MNILINEKKQAQCPSTGCGQWVNMTWNEICSQHEISCTNCRKMYAIFISQENVERVSKGKDIIKKEVKKKRKKK